MEEKIGRSLQTALNHKVKELVLFGSVLYTAHFRDVDIGICVGKSEAVDEMHIKFLLQQELEEIFEAAVDLVLLDDHFQSPLLIKSIQRKGITLISNGVILQEVLQKLEHLPNSHYLPTVDDLEEEITILEDMIFQTLYKGFACLKSWTEFTIVDKDQKSLRKHGMFMISTALQIKENMIRAGERIGKFLALHDLGVSFEFPPNLNTEHKLLSFAKPTQELYEGLEAVINAVRKDQRSTPNWEALRLNCRVLDQVEDRLFEEMKRKVQLVRELVARKTQ